MSSAAAYTIFSVHSASLTILWDVVQTTLVENFNRIYPSTITETLKRDIQTFAGVDNIHLQVTLCLI